MDRLCRILEHVIDAFDDKTLTQHDFIPKWHQSVFHVHFDSCNKMYAIFKMVLKKSWRDVPPVSKKPAVQLFGNYVPDFGIPVIHIGSGKTEGGDFSPVIAGEVQLESMAPPHCPLSAYSHALENLVGMAPEVMTGRNHRTVHEADTRTAAKGIELKEKRQLEEYAAFKFHEPVIGYRVRKVPTQMYPDIMQIVVLEVGERAKMKYNQDGHNLTVGKGGVTMPTANSV